MHKVLKNKFLVMLVSMVLLLGLVLPACTSTQAPPPPAGTLSYEATEFTNAAEGVSIKYPKEWAVQPVKDPSTLLYVASDKRVPALVVSKVKGATITEAFTAAVTGTGTDVKLVSEKQATLKDGTSATEAKFTMKASGMGADVLALGVKKGDSWIVAAVTTVNLLAKFDEVKFAEILYTLTVKK